MSGSSVEAGKTGSPTAAGPVKVSLLVLTPLVIGSMIGGAVFSLPSPMAAAATPGPLVIGWTIGLTYLLFVGLFYLVGTPFYIAARRRSGGAIFTGIDLAALLVFVATSVYAIWGLSTGGLSL